MATTDTRSRQAGGKIEPQYVKFKYGNSRYTVSPEKKKVYSDWVEVETSRAAEILTAFRSGRQI